jgi:hypothetical protein
MVSKFIIEAVHPRYSVTTYSCPPNFDNCPPSSGDDYEFTPAQVKLYDNGIWVVWAYRGAHFWRPHGMTASRIGGPSLDDTHYIAVSKKVSGENSWPQFLVLYADGNLRLIPHPPLGHLSVCFGASVIIGPAEPSERPIAEINSVSYRPSDNTLTVTYHQGGSAKLNMSVDRTKAVVTVDVNYLTNELPFATVRSMFVDEENCDTAKVTVWNNGSLVSDSTVLDADQKSGDEFVFYREEPSVHNMSAPDIRIGDFLFKGVAVTKCTVAAGSKDNSDTISISGSMGATADDFSGASVIEVTVNSEDMVNSCVQTFPIDEKSFKKGKYNYARTENASKTSFKFDTKTGKFSFTAKNVDLSGLACLLTVQIKIGDYTGEAEVNEAIVNGAKKPIPIKLMMGVKNSLRVDKLQVKRGKKTNSDQLSVKGAFAVEDINVNLVNEEFVVTLGTQTFTLPGGSFKAGKGKFTCSKAQVTEGGIAAANLNFNTSCFTLTIKSTNITASSGAVDFGVEFTGYSQVQQITLP